MDRQPPTRTVRDDRRALPVRPAARLGSSEGDRLRGFRSDGGSAARPTRDDLVAAVEAGSGARKSLRDEVARIERGEDRG